MYNVIFNRIKKSENWITVPVEEKGIFNIPFTNEVFKKAESKGVSEDEACSKIFEVVTNEIRKYNPNKLNCVIGWLITKKCTRLIHELY